MVLRFRGYEFSAGLLPTLATALGLALFVSLGQWQLERAKQKQGLIDQHLLLGQEAPVQVDDRARDWRAYRFRRGVVQGRYDLERQLLLDNRIHQGHAGYLVLTPFEIRGGDRRLLVNRGWIPMGPRRDRLPALPGPPEPLELSGVIDMPPEKVFRLGPDERQHTWPVVIQAIELDAIAGRLGYSLLPIVLQLDPEAPGALVQEWRPVLGIGPEKHRAYAVQWFSFAVILLGIFVGVSTRKVAS